MLFCILRGIDKNINNNVVEINLDYLLLFFHVPLNLVRVQIKVHSTVKLSMQMFIIIFHVTLTYSKSKVTNARVVEISFIYKKTAHK